MKLSHADAPQKMNTDRPYDNGSQHHLDDRKILEEQLADDHIVSRNSPLLEKKPKTDTQDKTDDQLSSPIFMKRL
jgi:hypothetical protein